MKLEDMAGRYAGQTVACLASGPSLTPEDVERVRHLPCLVTNTTFRLAPWADVLVGFDAKWWKHHSGEVAAAFHGIGVTGSRSVRVPGILSLADTPWLSQLRNSGAVAISLALYAGAARVLLLGFDGQKTGGRTHWHGDHPQGLGNAHSIKEWPRAFRAVAKYAHSRGQVLNCSRETAVVAFPRMSLEDALA